MKQGADSRQETLLIVWAPHLVTASSAWALSDCVWCQSASGLAQFTSHKPTLITAHNDINITDITADGKNAVVSIHGQGEALPLRQ